MSVRLEEINPKNVFYILQSIWNRIFKKEKTLIFKVANRAAQCPECWKAQECIGDGITPGCECPTFPMFSSDKPCLRYGGDTKSLSEIGKI